MNTNKLKHFAVILGARPNFVKAAPFFREAKNHPEFKLTIIHTGQHFDDNMSKVFFEEMMLPKPDISLNIRGEFHTEKIGKMLNALKRIFESGDYRAAIVFGDVNSTLAGAVAAIKNHCSLVHIEAGLRSHDRRMPEEISRVVVDHLSDLLFTTEPAANENLLKEGILEEKIKYVGNIMIESMEIFWDKINRSNILQTFKLKPKKYVVATLHRQENTDDFYSLQKILSLLAEVNKDIPIVFPLHPGTRKVIAKFQLEDLLKDLMVVEPLGYFEFMKLVKESQGVITDSGGIQDETSHLGIPCCTLRDNTERPITIEIGSNKLSPLSSTKPDEIKNHLQRSDFRPRHIPLWDDRVSKRIFASLENFSKD